MRRLLVAASASILLVSGCGRGATNPTVLPNPVSPTVTTPMSPLKDDGGVAVPFHSELTWEKIPGSDISLCTRQPPAGKIYLMRNTNTGTAVSTHLGVGAFEIRTCVYGEPGKPEGWFGDVRWTAANGDVLIATSDFLYWTGTPGKSVAVDRVTFQNGGTGRFQFAEGEGMSYVDAPARTARYEGTLRYGRNND